MSKVLVTTSERRKIAERFTVEMGTNVKYLVMDVDKVAKEIQQERKAKGLSMFIEIIPISEDQHKVPMRLKTFEKDPLTGVLYGIPAFVDDFGNIKWQKIQLNDSLTLNMENLNDAKQWAVLRFYPEIKGSPFQNENPYYQIYDPVIQAEAKEARHDLMRKAFGLVDKILDDAAAMVMFARYLGEELNDQANYKIVKAALLDRAEGNPAEFIEKYTSKDRKYHELFKTAMANTVIEEDSNSGFMFRNISIGLTEEEAVEFIKKDSAVAMSIADQISKTDKVIPIVSGSIKKEPEKVSAEIKKTAKKETASKSQGQEAKAKEEFE